MVTCAPGAEPLKYFAMSDCVIESGAPGLFAATVTDSRPERKTSPSLASECDQPVPEGCATKPYPGAASALSFFRLRVTRMIFGAYASRTMLLLSRVRTTWSSAVACVQNGIRVNRLNIT